MISRSVFRLVGVFAALTFASMPHTASAEGSAQVGANQKLQSTTLLKIDIINAAAETITWTGTNSLQIFKPTNSTNTPDVTLPVTTCIIPPLFGCTTNNTYDADVAGTYRAKLTGNEDNAWDITVNGATAGYGRVHSSIWNYNTGTFANTGSTNASYYALVPGGAANQTGVVELKLDGLSGRQYNIGANRTGVAGANAGRSVPNTMASGNTFTPLFEMYLAPPEISTYSPVTPTVTTDSFKFVAGAKDCNLIEPGTTTGTFKFNTNVDGTYNLVCDLDKDMAFNRVSPSDLLIVGLTTVGDNSVTWDGKNNAGVNVPAGNYNCKVYVNVGELHFVGEDIETSYKGLRLFGVSKSGMVLSHNSLSMFWNDTNPNLEADVNTSGVVAKSTSGADGVASGLYADAPVANTNTHAWGDFSGDSKGNNAFIDTFGSLLTVASAVASLSSVGTTTDTDADKISDYKEACTLGTNPMSNDSDGDGVSDTIETGTGATLDSGTLPVDSDNDGNIDALDKDSDNDGVCDGGTAVVGVGACVAGPDTNRTNSSICRDVDADSCDDCAVTHTGGGSVTTDGTDTDTDGKCNVGDPDDDNDGVCDTGVAVVGVCTAGPDTAPLDNAICGDVDADGCNDCAIVHTGGGAVGNDGTDTDMDGKCNVGDPDDDNDGVCDTGTAVASVCVAGPDTAPLSKAMCRDSDGDSCDDCTNVQSGGGDASMDGTDTDMDGLCDSGDTDKDGDGVLNASDVDPLDKNKCRDTDTDGCDDCAVVHTGGGDVTNDGTDTDSDGICDLGESTDDLDGDGVPDDTDKDTDNDGISDTDEGNGDHDGDGIDDKRDLDSDNDGIPDIIEAGGVDEDGDGRVDDFTDANDDGLDDGLVSKPLPRPDTDEDGLKDGVDLDSDADGISDVIEAGGGKLDADGNGRVDDTFDENDNGWDDSVDASADLTKKGKLLPLPDSDDDKKLDYQDADSDNDGVEDAIEGHDFDADGKADKDPTGDANSDGLDDSYKGLKVLPDTDKDKKPDYIDPDDDNDGLSTKKENEDVAKNPKIGADPDKDGIPSYLDPDSDGDGVEDGTEAMGDGDINDDGIPDYLQPTVYDKDSDGDGLPDYAERPNGEDVDSDGDGMPDYMDPDDDGDGVPTKTERPAGVSVDSDKDGKPDYLDADDDNDGVPTKNELTTAGATMDTDGDGTFDHLDADDDNDGIPTNKELDGAGATMDTDMDGKPNHLDTDDDNDGLLTMNEIAADGSFIDTDKDGIFNHLDPDDDGDGVPTNGEIGGDGMPQDSDHDGTPDHLDTDDDGDNIPTNQEHNDGGAGGIDNDIDHDGIPNYLDPDSDGDGTLDKDEAGKDADGDGVPDFQEPPTYGYAGGALCSTQHVHAGNAWGVFGILFLLSVLVIRRRAPAPGA